VATGLAAARFAYFNGVLMSIHEYSSYVNYQNMHYTVKIKASRSFFWMNTAEWLRVVAVRLS